MNGLIHGSLCLRGWQAVQIQVDWVTTDTVTPCHPRLLFSTSASRDSSKRRSRAAALRANERIPSVRAMSRTAKVSVSTVVQAYVHLENIGLIEARPQSGFYVRAPEIRSACPSRGRSRRARTGPASIANEVLDMCREALTRSDFVPLNGAFTSPAMYPTQRLNNLVREVLRDHPLNAGQCILPPGHEELRRQIAKRMALAGAPADPAHVVITERHDGCDHAGAARRVPARRYGAGRIADLLRAAAVDRAPESQSRRSAELSGRGHRRRSGARGRAQHASRRGGADAELQQSLRAASRRTMRSARSSRSSPAARCRSSRTTSTATCTTAARGPARCARSTTPAW